MKFTKEEKYQASKEEIKQCKNRLRGVNAKISNMLSIIERGISNEDIMSRLTELQILKKNINIQMRGLKDSMKSLIVTEDEIAEAIKTIKMVLLNKD